MAPDDVSRLTREQLLRKAVERLQDPKVRAAVLSLGMRAAQEWRDRRASGEVPASVGQPRFGFTRTAGDRFGGRRLERRVDNLRDALAALGNGRPLLAGSLEPVVRSVEDVSVALGIASALPRARRRKAHQRIEAMLDQLETGLFETTLGTDRKSDEP